MKLTLLRLERLLVEIEMDEKLHGIALSNAKQQLTELIEDIKAGIELASGIHND